MQLIKCFRKLFYPDKCVECGKLGSWICKKCLSRLEPAMPECYLCRRISNRFITHSTCVKGVKDTVNSPISPTLLKTSDNHYLNRVFIGWYYDEIAKKLISTFKYRDSYAVSELICPLLCNRLESTGFINELLKTGKITIIPTPVSPTRLLERGFNQTEYLAKSIVNRFGTDYSANLIIKANDDTHQARFDRFQRAANVVGKYQINESVATKLTKAEKLSLNFVIVDDLITTGSTINEIAGVVHKRFPNATVSGIALFRGKPQYREKIKEQKEKR